MSGDQVKIIVVDNEPDILAATVRVLRSEEYKVFETSTGKACLEMKITYHPDLILLDVVLPDIEGKCIASETLGLNPGTLRS
jgi:two-component system OmpR family response regulator